MEGTFPVGDHEFSTGSPSNLNLIAYFQQLPTEYTMDDLLSAESGAGDPRRMLLTPPALRPPPVRRSCASRVLTRSGTGKTPVWLRPTRRPPYSVGMGFNSNMRQVNATHTPSAAVEGIPPLVNAGPAHPQPDAYSTGNTSCCASAAAADMGSSSLDPEVNGAAGFLQSGGGALTKAAVRASRKRKSLVCGSSSQRSTPPDYNLVELEAGLVQSEPSYDIKPPAGSTDTEIIAFLKRKSLKLEVNKELSRSLAERDQTAPVDGWSYVTTVRMIADKMTHLGYWKEKKVKPLRDAESVSLCAGLKRTLQFHKCDGTKTNWFMHEYIPTELGGIDQYMEYLRYREVYKEGAQVPDPGEPTTPEVKIKNKIAAAKKHRMRGPENLVIKGESPAWQHFIKIYDRHPELEGSKVVYAVCCRCEGLLKGVTKNGTKSLLTHCDRTCPKKNKKQQQSS